MGESQSHHELSGAVGHVVLGRNVLTCQSPPQNITKEVLWQRMVNTSESWAEMTIPLKTNEAIQRYITIRSAGVVETLISMQ